MKTQNIILFSISLFFTTETFYGFTRCKPKFLVSFRRKLRLLLKKNDALVPHKENPLIKVNASEQKNLITSQQSLPQKNSVSNSSQAASSTLRDSSVTRASESSALSTAATVGLAAAAGSYVANAAVSRNSASEQNDHSHDKVHSSGMDDIEEKTFASPHEFNSDLSDSCTSEGSSDSSDGE